MTTSNSLSTQFRNHHNEEWKFTFESKTGIARVAGSDVDWQSYPVVDGTAVGLVLDPDETAWLRSIWIEQCSNHLSALLYAGRQTEFKESKRCSFLTKNYCPLCLLQKREFEIHHCIAATDGGPDTPSNLLSICNSCHAVITSGSIEDRIPKANAAFSHQVMHFGVRLFQDALAGPNKRTGNSFVDVSRYAPQILDGLSQTSAAVLARVDAEVKQRDRVEYQYLRDIGLGKWPWQEYEERFVKPMQRMLDEEAQDMPSKPLINRKECGFNNRKR